MSRKMLILAGVVILGCTVLYSQSTAGCDNTLNTVARNYENCKKTLFDSVSKTLLPLIQQREALKKELDALNNLLKNFDAEKDKLTKSIAELQNKIKEKGCVNCGETPPVAVPQNTTQHGGTPGGSSCKVGDHPSCKLENICQRCAGLIDHASGKSLCEVCGCHCKK